MEHNLHVHRESKNHERNMKFVTSQVETNANNGIFSCSSCDYSTSVKANYRKHVISAKHLNKIKELMPPLSPPSSSSAPSPTLMEVMDMFLKHQTDMSEKHLQLHASTSHNQQIQNTEMFKVLTDRILSSHQTQPPIMLEQTITNNTTTNNSKKFNLNVFLNEECKNAVNLSDFVKNVVVSIEDLEHLGNAGYVEGMTRILTKAIQGKETTERPMHCTDVKREKFIIRENDAWKKDVQHEETQRAVEHIAHKNYKVLMEWRQQHPEHEIADTPDYETWYRISRNMCNTDPGAMKKLLQHMATITAIEKEKLIQLS
jgi:hypothetical protein